MRNPKRYLIGVLLLLIIFILMWKLPGVYINGIPGLFIINMIFLLAVSEITDLYKDKLSTSGKWYFAAPIIKSFLLHILFIYILFAVTQFNQSDLRHLVPCIIIFYLIEMSIAFIKSRSISKDGQEKNYLESLLELIKNEGAETAIQPGQQKTKIKIADLVEDFGEENVSIFKNLAESSKCKSVFENSEIYFSSGQGNQKFLQFYSTPINDIKNANSLLAGINSEIASSGMIIVTYHSIESSYYTKSTNNNSAISRAEMWGRLHYCGFDVLNEITQKDLSYILAQKIKEMPAVSNKIYHPVIRLKRIGYKGEIFSVFKFRSMYPYSEYIQKKVFELNNFGAGGKFDNDFRITPLGKFIRKYWIDELPQIINWLKSDIKLVGIRGMSMHYFSLYPEYYQRKFIQVKPGLIPPIFDDASDDFGTIIKTEFEYLNNYLNSPVKTDFKYFFLTIRNILFKGFRGK